MSNHKTPPMAAPSIPETAAVWLLSGCVVIAPLLLGCSGIWTRFLLEASLAIATLAWVCSGQRTKWLTLMPTAMLALALLQTLPLPEGLLVRIAPVSAGAWKLAQGGGSPTWNSISVDPGASTTAAYRLFLACCTVAVGIDVGRRQTYRKRLLWAVAFSGGVMIAAGACFGTAKNNRMLGFINLAGPLTPETNPTILPVQTSGVGVRKTVTIGSLQYEVDEGYVGDGFGTYIYSNHFGGGVNLTFPAILALWLALTQKRLPGWVRWSSAAILWVVVTWLVGGVAHSRAGAGSLLLGGLALGAVAAETRAISWPATGLFAAYTATLALIAGLAVFALFGPGTGVLDLLPGSWKIMIMHALADARIVAAQVALRMAAASPLLGTGLETYETVFPRFHTGHYTMFFAHNDYAQFLAETGIAGAALGIGAGIEFAKRCARFCAQAKGGYRILNAGPWAALAGIGLHSALDWNLHLPANAFLACMVAALCASSVPATPWRFTQALLAWTPAWLIRTLLIMACSGSAVLLARDAASESVQRRVREAIVTDRLESQKREHGTAESALAAAVTAAERMAIWDSRNARLFLLLGQANLHFATYASPGAEQNARVGRAEIWFLKARQAAASARGLPTPAATNPR